MTEPLGSPPAEFVAEVCETLAFGEASGTVVLVDAPDAVLDAASASAAGLLYVSEHETQAEERLARIAPWTPAWTLGLGPADLPDREEVAGAAALFGPLAADLAVVERCLSRLVQGAPVRVAFPVGDRGHAGRVERLVVASCEPGTEVIRSDGWVVLAGRRQRFDDLVEEPVDFDVLPLAVVLLLRGRYQAEETALDVLLRQSYGAAELWVLDIGGPEGPVPDDLFGFAAHAGVPVVLLPKPACPPWEAWNDALSGVEQPWVGLVEGGERLAWNQRVCQLLPALNEEGEGFRDGVAAVTCRSAPRSAPLLRMDVVRELGGCDPAAGEACRDDLLRRVADRAGGIQVPLPLTRPRPIGGW